MSLEEHAVEAAPIVGGEDVWGLAAHYDEKMDEGIAPYLYAELDFKEVTSKNAFIINRYSQMTENLRPEASISIGSSLICA
uniref:Uncharacterized protein n=1 Tax=Oryza meridionalis TaxID=40149 RepID=A0A0E0EJU7_9ORYZ